MWNTFSHGTSMMDGFGLSGIGQGFWGFFTVVMLWSLLWKAFALWKAARRGDTIWFIALLILNTVGIVELLYLFVFSEPKGLLKDTKNTVVGGEKKETPDVSTSNNV